MLIELAIILLLVMANGVLAGAEIAVVSVRKTRIQALPQPVEPPSEEPAP